LQPSPSAARGGEAARERGAATVAFTGEDPRDLGPLADLVLRVPSASWCL
jgi:phosphoheptose isomerase